MPKKIAIIGAGFSGLLAGYFLSKKGHQITIFEKDGEVGGLLQSSQIGKSKIEKYYHHFFLNDQHLTKLIGELGLKKSIVWNHSQTGNLVNGKIENFSTLKNILEADNLTPSSRVRFIFSGLLISCLPSILIRNLKAKTLIIKLYGQENWEKVWAILFEKKFGIYSEQIGAPWFASRVKKKLSLGSKWSNKLGYISGGFEILLAAMKAKIFENNGTIFTDFEVKTVSKKNKKIKIADQQFDCAISTIPHDQLNKIAHQKIAKDFQYLGVICALIRHKKPLSPYYWINVLDRNLPFVCIVEQTNFVDKNNYQDHIIYLSKYCDQKDEDFLKNYLDLENEWFLKLKSIFPEISRSGCRIEINKNSYAQPIIPVGYKKPDFTTKMPSLFSLTMGHIVPEDRGLNEAVREAKKLCDII